MTMDKRYLYVIETKGYDKVHVAAHNQAHALSLAVDVLGISDNQETLSVRYDGEVYV